MKRIIKTAIELFFICTILAVGTLSTAASTPTPGHYGYFTSHRLNELTQEEQINEGWWEIYYSSLSGRNDPFITSIMRYEWVAFVKGYEYKRLDTKIRDLKNDYNDYISEKYSGLTLKPGEDGTYVEYDNSKPTDKITFTYDDSKKMYIGKNVDGKIIDTYERYFPEEDEFINPDGSLDVASTTSSKSSSSVNSASPYGTDSYMEPSTETVTSIQQEANENNGAQQVILFCIAAAIVVGIIIIIKMKRREKSE